MAINPLCIITEFLEGGSLYGVLHSNAVIEYSMTLEWAKGIAAGMLHLHREKIIHRDLAARNILLGRGNIVKISDFGMRYLYDLPLNCSRVVITNDGGKTATFTGPLKVTTRTFNI
jgi:serine/threonine protein kinase